MEKNFEGMMNFGVEELDSLIKEMEVSEKTEEVKERDPKKTAMNQEAMEKIIKGIAWKYSSIYVDREDLEQELWVRAYEQIRDCGGKMWTDLDLIARVCYNKAVDIYRYNRRRFDRKAEYVDETKEDSEEAGSQSDHYTENGVRLHSKLRSANDYLSYKEVIRMYPKDSKERKYLVVKLIGEGFLDPSDLDRDDQITYMELHLRPDFDFSDAEIVTEVLGYKSTTPGSWCGIKRRMKDDIKGFFGSEK